MCAEKSVKVFQKIYSWFKNFIAAPTLSALVGNSSYCARENRAIRTNSSSFIAEDESSPNGRDGVLFFKASMEKSIDKLCGFREPFFRGHKVCLECATVCPQPENPRPYKK